MIIGITGRAETGKSTVARMFKGFKIINVDKVGHKVLQKQAYEKVIKTFGKKILNKNKTINRKKLGKIVFSNKNKLKKLNKIMHSIMASKVKKMIKGKKVILEAAVLFEMKLDKLCKKVIVVKRNVKSKLHKFQMPESKLIKKADFVIDNNSTLANTKKQVLKIKKNIN
ncbi:dephospho-CoA kinase [Candidatus Woesearchaeota archaeon]|nr:dephospho-CoA kinase [Candidatus Woesearchaeota archaeon]